MEPRHFLRELFDKAVEAADPAQFMHRFLPRQKSSGRTIVVGAGKAAASMARAVEARWEGPIEGLVVTRDGHGAPTRSIEVVEASHPVPDARGAAAAGRILDLVTGLTSDDLVIVLISGGGSALLTRPIDGVSMEDKQELNRTLLKSGATIGEINTVRKHLSAVKGGRLAMAAAPARVLTIAISDVPGDDPAVIASGPTVADPTTLAAAKAVLAKYAITPPSSIAAVLEDPASETPKPGSPALAHCTFHMATTPMNALKAAAAHASGESTPLILGDALEGEARSLGAMHGREARKLADRMAKTATPIVLISGGETTVTVTGDGRGGRNAEYLLGLAIALEGHPNVWALAGDTDGIDGVEENAGAIVAPDTLARAASLGVDPARHLENNDAYSFFERLGDLVTTGPTLTNVNDFRAVLIMPPKTA